MTKCSCDSCRTSSPTLRLQAECDEKRMRSWRNSCRNFGWVGANTVLASDCFAWKTVRLGDEELFEFESGTWTGEKPPLVETAILRNTNFGEEGNFDYSNVAK